MANFTPIGYHTTPEMALTFVQNSKDPSEVKAELSGELLPVELPDAHFPCFLPVAAKIQRLLSNRHFQPVCTEGRISFQVIPPEKKEWKVCASIQCEANYDVAIERGDGRISFFHQNTLITWDWRTGAIERHSLDRFDLRQVYELKSGKLVLVAHKAHSCGENSVISLDGGEWFSLDTHISDIQPIKDDLCLIGRTLYDFEKKEKLQKFEGRIEVFSDGSLVESNKSKAVFYKFDKASNTFVSYREKENLEGSFELFEDGSIVTLNGQNLGIWSLNDGAYSFEELETLDGEYETRKLSEEWILFKTKEKKKLWNRKTRKWLTSDLEKTQSFECIPLTSNAVAYADKRSPWVYFYSNEKEKTLKLGNWSIDEMLRVSDASLVWATNPRGSGVHIASKEGEEKFSKYLGEDYVRLLKELIDGSILVQTDKRLVVLQPQLTSNSLAYKIEACKLRIKHNPLDWEAHVQLIQHYKESKEAKLKKQAQKAALAVAVRTNRPYAARRLAKKTWMNDYYLQLLEHSPFKKQRTQLLMEKARKGDTEAKRRLPTSRRCKTRLFVGEGNFSYTEALLEKHQETHPMLSKSITATDLYNPADDEIRERVSKLVQRGVQVLFGIDGTTIDQTFRGKHFQRIHWNCPFGDPYKREEFETVIPEFFQAASKLQVQRDRIHVTLMQGWDYSKVRQKENPIVKGATEAGYRLIRKRRFGKSRYKGYKHVKTGTNTDPELDREYPEEFVFEKAEIVAGKSLREQALALKNPEEKEYEVKDFKETHYFSCSSDDDSSDYYESD